MRRRRHSGTPWEEADEAGGKWREELGKRLDATVDSKCGGTSNEVRWKRGGIRGLAFRSFVSFKSFCSQRTKRTQRTKKDARRLRSDDHFMGAGRFAAQAAKEVNQHVQGVWTIVVFPGGKPFQLVD